MARWARIGWIAATQYQAGCARIDTAVVTREKWGLWHYPGFGMTNGNFQWYDPRQTMTTAEPSRLLSLSTYEDVCYSDRSIGMYFSSYEVEDDRQGTFGIGVYNSGARCTGGVNRAMAGGSTSAVSRRTPVCCSVNRSTGGFTDPLGSPTRPRSLTPRSAAALETVVRVCVAGAGTRRQGRAVLNRLAPSNWRRAATFAACLDVGRCRACRTRGISSGAGGRWLKSSRPDSSQRK